MGFGDVALRLLAGLGVFSCVLIGGKASNTAWTIWRAPDRPAPSTVAAAPDNAWVLLQDAVLDCPAPGKNWRLVPAHAREGGDRFRVYLEDPSRCATTASLDGAFIGKFSRATLRMQGVKIPPGADERIFSQLESPPFLWRRLGSDLAWFGASLLVVMLAIRALWRREAAGATTASVTKSGRAVVRE
jgi:hypothetical protein